MQDIAPELLKKIQDDFKSHFDKSDAIKSLYAKVKNGTATYAEANDFAIETGKLLSNAFQNNISSDVLPDGRMYYNIAKRVVEPTMLNNYNLITDVTNQVQKHLNQSANIGIKAITPPFNQDRVNGIINRLSSEVLYDDVAWILTEPIVNASQSIVDDAIYTNADFHAKAGMRPKIIRKLAGGCCEWCRQVAGTYTYPDVPKDVFRRHQRCRCTVEYNPKDGRGVQNSHTKKWTSQAEHDIIEKRKISGLLAEDDAVQKHIRENIIANQNISQIVERQQIHRVGTPMYNQRKVSLEKKGQYGPSYITISDDEVLELVSKYSGKGDIKLDKNGNWNHQEVIVTNEKMVGVVFNNQTGFSVETSVFKIHYADTGIHIVPDYPSKKR